MAAHRSLRWMSRILVLLVLLSLIVPPFTASAAVPPFRGEYYNNRDLSGAPLLVRDDASINFSWGDGSPGSPINKDNFSARWTNFCYFDAGTYTFTVRVDDGVRLWVDDVLIIDRWNEQPATTFKADRTLGAGYHSLRLEFFEVGGEALVQLSWALKGTTPTYPEWKGEYFTNASLLGTPTLVRNDPTLSFNWGYGSPAAGIPSDNFSARWTRQINIATPGTYTFQATADDGIRVKVDGTLVIDRWLDQSATTTNGSIWLGAGAHNVVVEYYERGGVAQAQVSWSLGTTPTTTTIVVDDVDPKFTRGNTLTGFNKQYFGYNNHLFWVWNNNSVANLWGRWTPTLPAPGNYEVQVYIPRMYFGTTSARYRVYHNGTRDDKIVSQALYYDQWVSLGTYYFHGRGGEYVFLANNTGEAYASRPVGYDAVRFIGSGSSTTPSPQPTPAPGGCAITPVSGFGTFWSSNSQVRSCLGCPTDSEKSVWMGEQTFIGGKAFWRDDTDVIYVLFNDGTWQQFPDSWKATDPEYGCSAAPPAGYYQPKRGFGKLWCENAVIKNKLSWGTMEEHGTTGAVEPFEHGLMIWTPAQGVYMLCNDGRWLRY